MECISWLYSVGRHRSGRLLGTNLLTLFYVYIYHLMGHDSWLATYKSENQLPNVCMGGTYKSVSVVMNIALWVQTEWYNKSALCKIRNLHSYQLGSTCECMIGSNSVNFTMNMMENMKMWVPMTEWRWYSTHIIPAQP